MFPFPNDSPKLGGFRLTTSTAADSLSALAAFTELYEFQADDVAFCQNRYHRWYARAKHAVHHYITKPLTPLKSRVSSDVSGVTSKRCAVCDDAARGYYFGALICLPCKSFFMRYIQRNQPAFRHACDGKCDVTTTARARRCSRCRFQKCLSVGMSRKERPEMVIPKQEEALCAVCGDISNGVHFGVPSCEGCKKFFLRSRTQHSSYSCKSSGRCTINPRVRTSCRYCRFQKCLKAGMSRQAIKVGIQKKGKQHRTCPGKTIPPKQHPQKDRNNDTNANTEHGKQEPDPRLRQISSTLEQSMNLPEML